MTDYSFALRSPADLLEKLKRELERLQQDETYQSDHAFNFAVTAWHMTDWVHKDARQRDPTNPNPFGYKRIGNFQQFVRGDCRALGICDELANGSKHFEKHFESAPENKKTVLKTDASIVGGASLGVFKLDVDRLAGTVLIIRLTGDESVRAEEVFAEAIAYWTEFFDKHGLC